MGHEWFTLPPVSHKSDLARSGLTIRPLCQQATEIIRASLLSSQAEEVVQCYIDQSLLSSLIHLHMRVKQNALSWKFPICP